MLQREEEIHKVYLKNLKKLFGKVEPANKYQIAQTSPMSNTEVPHHETELVNSFRVRQ